MRQAQKHPVVKELHCGGSVADAEAESGCKSVGASRAARCRVSLCILRVKAFIHQYLCVPRNRITVPVILYALGCFCASCIFFASFWFKEVPKKKKKIRT